MSEQLKHTTKEQTLEFYVNAAPYTGGPSYMMFDAKDKKRVFWDGNSVTISMDSMEKIQKAIQPPQADIPYSAMYKVNAKFEIEEIKEENTSIPDAPTETYYMVKILEVYSASIN